MKDFLLHEMHQAEIWYRQAYERAKEPQVKAYFLGRAEECRRRLEKPEPK